MVLHDKGARIETPCPHLTPGLGWPRAGAQNKGEGGPRPPAPPDRPSLLPAHCYLDLRMSVALRETCISMCKESCK